MAAQAPPSSSPVLPDSIFLRPTFVGNPIFSGEVSILHDDADSAGALDDSSAAKLFIASSLPIAVGWPTSLPLQQRYHPGFLSSVTKPSEQQQQEQ